MQPEMRKHVMSEILLRHPACSLRLEKGWDSGGQPHYRFVLQAQSLHQEMKLLEGAGHEVPRRDMHHALYLFRSLQIRREEDALPAVAANH